jgi:hypothetical protein
MNLLLAVIIVIQCAVYAMLVMVSLDVRQKLKYSRDTVRYLAQEISWQRILSVIQARQGRDLECGVERGGECGQKRTLNKIENKIKQLVGL